MSHQEPWRTTVDSLLGILQGSFLALQPHMSAARIETGDESYDDWDRISEALFESIVLSPIRWCAEAVPRELKFPSYGDLRSDYSELSRIDVVDKRFAADAALVFVKLVSREQLFDTVQCVEIQTDGSTRGRPREVPVRSASFYANLRVAEGNKEVRELRVEA